MKNIFRLLILVLCGNPLVAQSTLHDVEGKITDKSNGAPVPFAVIYLPDANRSASADENGNFRIAKLPGTSQKFSVMCTGYHSYSTTVFFTDTLTHVAIQLEPGGREMEEFVVYGTQEKTSDQTSGSISAVSQRTLRAKGALSISDGVARLPGVTQLSTGAGISKPVIRGLYGNRIQTVVMGMRFDNQQWQDEHGLGLGDIGVDRVEVIKGPAALMYGSEAMGGVLNIIEERPAPSDSMLGDASTRFFSNTYGLGFDAGIRAAKENHFWRIRLGTESHADYSDGNNHRVLNSRFDGYVGKATYGFSRKNWSCVNNYVFSKNDFGFLMDTGSVLVADARLSRDFSQPHHTVFINLFTSQLTFFPKDGNIHRIILGGHINRRMEQEGGKRISLDMQLVTLALHYQFEHAVSDEWSLLTGLQSQFQDNRNFGSRIIVPDARLAESSVYFYMRRLTERSVFEFGVRGDLRYIQTDTLEIGNNFPLIDKTYPAVNGSAGWSQEIVEGLRIKANITSGYRTPNLAELASNGVHEGTFRFEKGNPAMKIEQNFCTELGLSYERKEFEVSVTAYNNRFFNYIYLQPTNGDYFGFRIYEYVQTNATLQGGEATLDWSPEKMDWLDFSSAYMMIRAKTDAGNYLPFIPADRLDNNLKFELGDKGKWTDIYIRLGSQYYFPQNHPAQFETSTADYLLFDAGLGSTIKLKKNQQFDLDICANNLLNKTYYDHLSRYKEFGIYNMGRNICVNFKYSW